MADGSMADGPPVAVLVEICAAPGTGKTTVLPPLVRLAAEQGIVVADIDELLEDDALLGVPIATPTAAPVWPAYDRLWTRITLLSRRAGHPFVLLGQVPDEAELRAGPPSGVLRVGWDVPDAVRIERLRARGWDDAAIDDARDDAALVRSWLPDVAVTDPGVPPDAVAAALLDRVVARLDRTGPPTA